MNKFLTATPRDTCADAAHELPGELFRTFVSLAQRRQLAVHMPKRQNCPAAAQNDTNHDNSGANTHLPRALAKAYGKTPGGSLGSAPPRRWVMQNADITTQGNTRPQVLIAEDDAVVRLLLKHWLTAWGFDVTEAADGDEAWAVLQQEQPPKLIVLDWMMPGLDGIELCRRIRARSTPYYQYILMVTGRSDMGHVVHALESGADDCIGKPFEQSELQARINVANRILALQDELIAAREELRLQAMKDSLTGMWNRAAFQELFEVELERAARAGSHVGLLLLDIDHFKIINDTYGHMTGDLVLRTVARVLKQNVRAYDFEGRFGGEEFLIAVPGCGADQLREHAERVRAAVAATPIQAGDAEIRVTISVGATVSSEENTTFDAILALADGAMYRAKHIGRNCAVFCTVKGNEKEHPQDRCGACQGMQRDSCMVTGSQPQ